MKFQILELKQNKNTLYSGVIPFDFINTNSHVLVYGKDEGGYQREPDKNHYNKIKKYVLEEDNYIFPTSIILGLDSDKASDIIVRENEKLFITLENSKPQKIFRVIDGQHRLKGIESAIEEKESLKEFPLNVIILETDIKRRSQEMNIFNTINSKSKRIKVDLIKLAQFDYRIIEDNIGPKELVDHISIKIANLLNDDCSEKNVWQNAIKFGIHEDEKIGLIGVHAFSQSIQTIVSQYISEFNDLDQMEPTQLIEFANTSGMEIKNFLNKIWEIVQFKWEDCFYHKKQTVIVNGELTSFYFNKTFYIQKTLGTKAINYTLGEIVKLSDEKVLSDANLEKFENVIKESKILTSDWKMGVTFGGYSSESAFTKVRKMIMGELDIPRN